MVYYFSLPLGMTFKFVQDTVILTFFNVSCLVRCFTLDYIYIHVYIYVWLCVFICVWVVGNCMFVFMCTFIYIFICFCICNVYIYIYIYMYVCLFLEAVQFFHWLLSRWGSWSLIPPANEFMNTFLCQHFSLDNFKGWSV